MGVSSNILPMHLWKSSPLLRVLCWPPQGPVGEGAAPELDLSDSPLDHQQVSMVWSRGVSVFGVWQVSIQTLVLVVWWVLIRIPVLVGCQA